MKAVTAVREAKTTHATGPARYALLVAQDYHLAAQFAQLNAVGDANSALEVVRHAADDILERCNNMLVFVPTGENSSLLQCLDNIETVAKRSDQRGDESQARWCILLHEKLAARAGLPPRGRSGSLCSS